MKYIEYDEKMIQSFEYETTIVNDGNLLGTCELGKATIQMINDDNKYSSFKGSWINTVHGSFYIYNVAPVQEKVNIRLECYDIKYKLDTLYDSTKHIFPCTLKEWRNSIFNECKVEYDDSDFPNSDLMLEKEPYVGKEPSNRNVIALIAQAGASLVITIKDKFYFSWFEDTTHIADDWVELTTEKETSNPVNCIVLGRGNVEDNVKYPIETPENPIEFRIDNNYILDPHNEVDIRYQTRIALYNQINGLSYLIFNLRTQFIKNKLSIQLGQKIKYLDIYDNELIGYIMTKKITWLGGNLDNDDNYEITLSAEKLKETSTDLSYCSNVNNDLLEAERTLNKHEGLIRDFSKKIIDLLDCIKETKNKGDNLHLENTPVSHGAINKLSVTGFELQTLYPNMVYPSENLYPNVLNFYTLIFSNEEVIYAVRLPNATGELENKIYNVAGINGKYYRCVKSNDVYEWIEDKDFEYQEIYVNSPIPLQTIIVDSKQYSDELLIEENNIKVIQKISAKNELLAEPITHDLGPYTIPTYDGNTYVTFKYFKNLNYECKYLIKNDLTSIFSTQVETIAELTIMSNQIASKVSQAEMNSAILQKAQEINLEVAKKVNSDKLISTINMSPETIKILAKYIQLEGIVTANEFFKILLDGSVEAKNGKFSGNIYLNEGNLVIGGNGILSTMIVTGVLNSPRFLLSGDFCPLGDLWDGSNQHTKEHIAFSFFIPDDFTVINAYIHLQHEPCETSYYDSNYNTVRTTGNCRNLALYKGTLSTYSKKHISETSMGFIGNASASYSQITGAWQGAGTLFTGANNSISSDVSINLKSQNQINKGLNHFAIMSTGGSLFDVNTGALPDSYYQKRGAILATMYVQGYLKN